MSTLIVPPLADPTLEINGDGEVVDLNAYFFSRHADTALARSLAERLDQPDSADPLGALSVAAASEILSASQPDRAHLRAVGAVLRAVTAEDNGLSVTIDDVHLRSGSTQSSAAVAAAIDRTEMFDAVVAAACERSSSAPISMLLDTDMQLPAAMAIARALPVGTVRPCGRFADAHVNGLSAILAGKFTSVGPRPEVVRIVRSAWVGNNGVRWITGVSECPSDGEWSGWLPAEDLTAFTAADFTRCRGVVLGIAQYAGDEMVVGMSGGRVDLAPMFSEIPSGIPVFVEILVGAPGVDRGASVRTLAWAVNNASPVRLAGLRPFRLPIGQHHWGDTSLTLGPPEEHDLPRVRTFTAAETMTVDESEATVRELLANAADRADLFPGRIAGSVTCAPGVVPVNDLTSWDRSSAIVTTRACAPDDGPPGDFLVSLRTGTVQRLSAPLCQILRRLASGDPDASNCVPDATWARLTARLRAAGHLRRPS